jgi:two-component system sensor histidine kinase PilS (NtrC family)
MHPSFENRQWLAWLVKVRILILTIILGIELAIAQFTTVSFPINLFIGTILVGYAVSFFYLGLLRISGKIHMQSALQIATDLVLVSMLVYITGGVDSSLNFLYPLVIIVASILFRRAWGYLIAALAFILYGTVLELCFFQIIPSYSATHPAIRTLQALIFVNFFGYVAVAYLAGLLAAKLRQADTRLEDTRGALENLQALHENITLVNAAAEKLLERSETELLALPIAPLFQDPLPSVGSDPSYGEMRFIAPNDFRKTFRVMLSELRIPGRGAVGHVYTLDDLTQIRRLEREVRMQDRLAAVGRLSAAIAHEVRNPLTSIAGSASLLAEMPDLSDEHRRLLQIVTRESERLNNIITDFLAYSRNKQYKFANVDLIPLLEDTLTLLEHRMQAQNTGITIVRSYAAQKTQVLADGDRMKQVFWNFCENAVRAMKKGGTLTVSIDEMEHEWQLSFADTGPGMSPQMVEKIFEPFQSQFEGGTGLGLAIVYQIVQAHEGKVFVRSKPQQGCTFVLRLRKAAAVAVPSTQVAEPAPVGLIGRGAHA